MWFLRNRLKTVDILLQYFAEQLLMVFNPQYILGVEEFQREPNVQYVNVSGGGFQSGPLYILEYLGFYNCKQRVELS